MRLLVVDDNLDIRVLLTRNFEQVGHDVVAASSGEEALALLQESQFDAVVSDVLMPEGSGTWLVGELRKSGNQVPVVLISASHDISRSEALKVGANEFLRKPLDIFKLEEALEKIAV